LPYAINVTGSRAERYAIEQVKYVLVFGEARRESVARLRWGSEQ